MHAVQSNMIYDEYESYYCVFVVGWIAIGVSGNGDMSPADIGLGWVTDNGSIHFGVRLYFITNAVVLTCKSSDLQFYSRNLKRKPM